MIPQPTALGLILCDYVIVEEGTRKISTIGHFDKWKATQFPSVPRPFCVFTRLTDAHGTGIVDLVISRLETEEEIHSLRVEGHFPHRLAVVPLLFRINDCSFPTAGSYVVTLSVDGVEVAEHRLPVYAAEDLP
jgi:hypothetical protein